MDVHLSSREITRQTSILQLSASFKKLTEMQQVVALDLPDLIWLQIFSALPIAQLLRCASVCKRFHQLSLDQLLWKCIFDTTFANKLLRSPPDASSSASIFVPLPDWKSEVEFRLNPSHRVRLFNTLPEKVGRLIALLYFFFISPSND